MASAAKPVAVQVPAVQGGPAAVRPLDAVGDDQMGVHQRVAFSGRPVVKPDRHQPLAGHVLDTTMATAGAQVLVQVADRLGQPRVMGGQHRQAGDRIPEAVEDRDALGGPQDHIEGRHRLPAMRAAEQLAGCGVAALEHGLERGHECWSDAAGPTRTAVAVRASR